MSYQFQTHPKKIIWKIHFKSNPQHVYQFINTDVGREKWWAETAQEQGGFIEFIFFNNFKWTGKITSRLKNKKFAVNYFGSIVTFNLKKDSKQGTDLTLWHSIPLNDPDRIETAAGWVSVLLAMKAAVDFGVDLRNHEAKRSWIKGYCDN